MRDLTQTQFESRLEKYGITREYFGYYAVTHDEKGRPGLHVYAGNAGDRRRSQLAYLIAEQQKYANR